MFEDQYPGACISCGFLGLINPLHGGSGVLHEFPAKNRANGYLAAKTTLWCHRRMANIQREVDQAEQEIRTGGSFQPQVDQDNERYAAVRRVLCAPRPECVEQGKWYAYVEFFEPKWHYEDWRMMELERRQREWEERLARQAQEAEEKRHSLGVWIAIAAGVLALAEVVAAVLGAGPGSILADLLGLD